MERILKGTSATISVTVEIDGVATDPSPDSATVEVLRDDGTVLVASTAANNAGTGKFTFPLTPTHTARLDLLKARWTVTIGGQAQTLETEVEVVGGFHFSLAYGRKLPPLGDATTYPTPDLVAERTMAEEDLELACGVAFVPRYARTTVYGDGRTTLRLPRRRVTKLQKVLVDGVALTVEQLAALKLRSGRVTSASAWTLGSVVDVFYEHGFLRSPGRLPRVARQLVRARLVDRLVDDRTTSLEVEGGRIAFATARGESFDLPEVNAFVRDHQVQIPLLR